MAVHFVAIRPATHFDFRYQSRDGEARVIHLDLANLTADSEELHSVEQFYASVHPRDRPTLCTFYTLPETIPMSAAAVVCIEGGVPGDSIICHNYSRLAGLKVDLRIIRGGVDILRENIEDTDEHKFMIR
jgi:hypothetical protein